MSPVHSLWRRVRAWRERRVLVRRAIPEALWRSTLSRFPFLARRSAADVHELRRLATLFLASKEFTAVGGLRLTDAKAVAIAAQACLPILRFGLAPYAGFVGIVLQPAPVRRRREWTDETGVVHHDDEVLSGEAMHGGPVMLSWQDVAAGGRSARWGYNVVIHEFVHVLDAHDGVTADALPPQGTPAAAWRDALEAQYRTFCAAVDSGEDTLLDAYGSHGLTEFFPVAAEAFFAMPADFQRGYPELYGLLASYFRQDPVLDALHAPSR